MTYNNTTANSLHRVRIDYYHLTSISNATFSLAMTPPGGTKTTAVASYFMPDYSLQTSATSYDATYGNTTATTSYGNSPELGLAQSATVDPSGLNLTASASYETPGTGYLRPLSGTLPGGGATTYAYYAGTDTLANPCVTGSPAAYQAGMLKTKTYANSKIITYVYDDAGNVVATQTNTDGWDCKTYDARERLIEDDIPAYANTPARTVTYNYSVGGNPLVTSITDSTGTITTTVDLLGRTVIYRDVDANTTNTTYDNLGRMTSKASDMGTISYTYDNYNRLSDEQLNSTYDLARPSYDSYGRLRSVNYPSAGTLTETVGYDSTTGAESTITHTLPNGTSITDTVTRSQSGKISTDALSSGTSSLNSTYTYDHAGRLTSAAIGSNNYSYSFGAQSGSCAQGTNANSGKDGNRTSQTINGVTTTYCYNSADQLVSSSDPTADNAQYEAHGNLMGIGATPDPLYLYYDQSDRNDALVQYGAGVNGNGDGMYYARDAQDRITYREHDTISSWNWILDGAYDYGYTGSGNSPSFVRNDSTWNIIEEYVSLPGGVLLTIPGDNTQTSHYAYNLPNIHGDTLLTVNGSGANTSTGTGPASSYTYDPFGNPLPGSTIPNDSIVKGSFAYEGSHEKVTENTLPITPMVLGARIYLPTIGRFTSMDPIDGGNANAYVYALDPINFSDLSGLLSVGLNYGMQGGLGAAFLQPTTTIAVIQSPTAIRTARIAVAAGRAAAKPAAKNNSTRLPVPTVNATNITKIGPDPRYTTPSRPDNFDTYNAVSSAYDWFDGGALIGGGIGCAVGAVPGAILGASLAGIGAIPGAAAGCIGAGTEGAAIGGPLGAATGYYLGGNHLPGAEAFDWLPYYLITPWQ